MYDKVVFIIVLPFKWADVFDESTGYWCFSSTSPSQKTVDRDPFSEELAKNIKLRDSDDFFSPPLPECSCDCGVRELRLDPYGYVFLRLFFYKLLYFHISGLMVF